MKHFKQLIFFPFAIIFLLVNSCKEKESSHSKQSEAKGGKSYGGVFRLSEAEYIKNLFPPSITDNFSYRIASQIYEGLFKFDPRNLKVINSLTESYTVDSTATIYTIKLKDNVFFHNDDCFSNGGAGREMTAEDVKYCFTQLCTQSGSNLNFILFKDILKGANAYFAATEGSKKPNFEVEGIKVIDKKTIQLTLEKPNSIFIYNLARAGAMIYPKEAFEKYGKEMRIKSVGTGAFYLAQVDEGISMILKRNEKYYGVDSLGNKLPFLEAIDIKFIKDKKNELFEFQKGNLDMLYRIPTEFIIDVVSEMGKQPLQGEYQKYELQRSPEMLTQFLVFQTEKGIFKDKNVRKAISYAIDREKILNFVLNGEGDAPGLHGVTPNVYVDYKINKIKGYGFSKDSAQFFLKKAGYGGGKGFPKIVLKLNSEGNRNNYVAVEIQKQLKDFLNIDVELEIIPFAESIDDALKGDYQLLRIAWAADYPNPENFLSQFYGKSIPKDPNANSFPNVSRYKNKSFDDLYEKGIKSKNQEEAYINFAKAEDVLMDDAPILVLWYDEGYRLVYNYVKNFPNNAMQYRDLSQVYLEKTKK